MDYYNNLPPHVRQYGLACGWQYQFRPGSEKPAKVPIDIRTGNPANPSDQTTFIPLSELTNFDYKKYGYDGIGLGIFGNICAIDIDHCVDANGKYSDMAIDIINTMQSYAEISPSDHGIRILFLATNFDFDKNKYYINNQKIGLEVYVAGATNKYVSLTGNAICKVDLVESGELLQIVLDKYMLRPQHGDPTVQLPVPSIIPDDTALLEKACSAANGDKFSALYSGDTSEYGGDDSAADMAMCNMLAFWTGRNAEQMDRLFRQSGLMRDKWDRPTGGSTYGQITIEKAIAGATQVYTPKIATVAKDPVAYNAATAAESASSIEGIASSAAANTQIITVANNPTANVITPGVISAKDLYQISIPPVQYVVEELLAVGTTILAAAPKLGKSWLVLLLGLCVAAGKPFLGYYTHQCGVLYLALEDGLNRLKSRMIKLLDGAQPPENFDFATEIPNMDNGLFLALDKYLESHPHVRLIIIDTLQYVRGSAVGRETLYAQDYREMKTLKLYMAKKGVSLLLVHHTRKQKDSADGDIYEMISGSQGLLGGADCAWVISKKKRKEAFATLHVTGRDVQQNSIVMTFDSDNCHWNRQGTADEVAEKNARAVYFGSPIIRAIKLILANSDNGKWAGLASELIQKSAELGVDVESTPQKVGIFLEQYRELLEEYDNIIHTTSSINGSGGKKHHFKHVASSVADPDDTTVADPDAVYDDDDELPSRQEDYRYLSVDATHDLLTENCQYD